MNDAKAQNTKHRFGQKLFVAGFLLMLLGFWCVSPAMAQYQCTDSIYFIGTGNNNVYRYALGGAITQVAGVSVGGPSAAAAIKPDGTRLYSVNSATPYVLRYNSGGTTNSTATATAMTSTAQRNAIAPDGTGYFMEGTAALAGQYYTYTTSGTTPTVAGPFTLTVQPTTAPAIINGGDIAIDANGIGYLIDQGRNFYRLDFSTNTANFLGTFSGTMNGNPNGLGFITTTTNGQNFLYASTLNNILYRLDLAAMTVNQVTPTATVGGFAQNDIASCIYPVIAPSVAATKAWRNVTKGDPATFATSTAAAPGDTIEYRVVVRNTGVIAAGNTTFQDAIPSGLTYVSGSTTLNGAAVTDNAGTGNARFYYAAARTIQGYGQTAGSGVVRVDSTAETLTDNEAVVTFRATVGNPFNGTANPILNTAQIRYAGSNPGAVTTVDSNQTSTPVLVADLQAAKSQRLGATAAFQTAPLTVNQNSIVQYQLVFTNNGSGTVTNAALSDNVPSNLTGLSVVSATGAAGATACSASFTGNNLTGGFSGGSGATCTVIIQGTATTTGSNITNTAMITAPTGVTDPAAGNNSSQTVINILSVADLSVVKSQRSGASGAFQNSTEAASLAVGQGGIVQYQLVFTNNGSATATNAVLSDSVPSNLTNLSVVSATGANGATVCSASFGTLLNQNNLTGSFSGAAGAICTIVVQGTATVAGSFTNTARITPANNGTVADPNCSGSPVACTGNNESSVNTAISLVFTISGTIFEDAGYAGGAGRSLASANGTGRGGATVELYNSLGVLIGSTTTSTASGSVGQYQFASLLPGSYTVRVVNSTVSSARSGYVSTLIGVQTFRTNNGTADANRVGGEDPTKIDAGANTLVATLVTLLGGATTTAQSLSPVTITTANAIGVDFGFNFDTVVNTNNAGQGSLRQFITNANALSGADKTIFMISNGGAHAGLRPGLTDQLTGGVAVITLAATLPALIDSLTTIDGTTQTANVGNTNSGAFGTGGTVGVDNLSLGSVERPEVQIADGANLAIGLDLQGTQETVRGISIYGFGNAANSNDHTNLRLGPNAANAFVEANIIGANIVGAIALADPGSSARSGGDNVRSVGADNGILRNNLIAFSAGKGFGVEEGSTGWLIEYNEIRNNAIGNSNFDGIDLESAGSINNTVRGNLIYANEGVGVDSYDSNGSNKILNNTIYGNGAGSGGNVETAGVRVYGANNLVELNRIYSNYGAGVMVTSGASANTITRNSIYANGTITKNNGGAASAQIGIDLLAASDNAATGTASYVTLNDAGDGDAGANGLLNFPVLEAAQILNGNLILKGYARPGAALEFFIAAPDPSGFGEGQTYLVTLTEGAVGVDTDATNGTYTSPVGGRTVGTDATNRFNFSLALPAGVSPGTALTATATLSGATSEFSNTISVGNAPPVVGLLKCVVAVETAAPCTQEATQITASQLPGAEIKYIITFTNTGGQAAQNFALTDPNPANTTLKINNSTDFKVGSAVTAPGTSNLTAAVTYSNDGGATFAYTPVSQGGGAPAGYDRNVTHVRWTFAGALSQIAPNNQGSVSFVVKIR